MSLKCEFLHVPPPGIHYKCEKILKLNSTNCIRLSVPYFVICEELVTLCLAAATADRRHIDETTAELYECAPVIKHTLTVLNPYSSTCANMHTIHTCTAKTIYKHIQFCKHTYCLSTQPCLANTYSRTCAQCHCQVMQKTTTTFMNNNTHPPMHTCLWHSYTYKHA